MTEESEETGTPSGPYIAGILDGEGKYNADDLPRAQPDGVISFMGSSWGGEWECYPIIDMKVAMGGETITALLSLEMAQDMSAALAQAIKAAEDGARELEDTILNDKADERAADAQEKRK